MAERFIARFAYGKRSKRGGRALSGYRDADSRWTASGGKLWTTGARMP
jgi:hypothetical protein